MASASVGDHRPVHRSGCRTSARCSLNEASSHLLRTPTTAYKRSTTWQVAGSSWTKHEESTSTKQPTQLGQGAFPARLERHTGRRCSPAGLIIYERGPSKSKLQSQRG
jgi:hypothetical protein